MSRLSFLVEVPTEFKKVEDINPFQAKCTITVSNIKVLAFRLSLRVLNINKQGADNRINL